MDIFHSTRGKHYEIMGLSPLTNGMLRLRLGRHRRKQNDFRFQTGLELGIAARDQ
jgi:hypothetical protein